MDSLAKYLIVFVKFLAILKVVYSDTYTVKVGTESHVNVVDSRFLSFTVDPKYIFSSSEKYNSKESVCMASSLTPAYIRIAGPSTSHMIFHNSTITFTDLTATNIESDNTNLKKSKETSVFRKDKRFGLHSASDSDEDLNFKKNKRQTKLASFKKSKGLLGKRERDEKPEELAISHSQWKKFVQWAKSTGFDLVFALNNEEKNPSGLWDPNSALNILTLAEKANFTDIYWQLGYECTNQSMDEYLNDLETLRAIAESFGAAREWRAVGGDVTQCLHADSKSDFRDYVTLTDDMMDAVVLNGNSSAQELQSMSEPDRLKLLKLLSTSSTPLWLVDSPPTPHTELHRAADWMTSLGYSARNGFAVHFRELVEEELFEPTLGFYMALLFKNLVGDRVLDVEMEASQAVLFAHCTSLRHKHVPGAITLYAANMDDEPARFAVKLSRREDGGDFMQFILGHDLNGNIIINGRAMYEGDIRPVVKRVRPYKTLLLNLPPRSFGFWVIANTKIEACQEIEDQDVTKKEFVEALTVSDDEVESIGTVKTKRSMVKVDSTENLSKETLVREGLKERIENLKTNLNNVNKMFESKANSQVLKRRKRNIEEDEIEIGKKKLRKVLNYRTKNSDEMKPRFDFLRKMFGLNPRSDGIKTLKHDKVKRLAKFARAKLNKRNIKYAKLGSLEDDSQEEIEGKHTDNKLRRKRRNILNEKQNISDKEEEDISLENEIDADTLREIKLWKILRKIHKQIEDLPTKDDDDLKADNSDFKDEDLTAEKTRVPDGTTQIIYKENARHGLLKSTVNNVVSVLGDLNKNLNKFWNALTLLE